MLLGDDHHRLRNIFAFAITCENRHVLEAVFVTRNDRIDHVAVESDPLTIAVCIMMVELIGDVQ